MYGDKFTKGSILPANQALVASMLKQDADNILPDHKRREAMIEAAKDPQKSADYAAARMIRVYRNFLADSRALELFEYVSLEDDQLPELLSETDQSYNTLEIQQQGGPPHDNFVNKDTVTQYLMYDVTSDRIFYPTKSIQTGQLRTSDRVNTRMSYQMNRHVNKDVWTLIDAAYASYPSGTWEKDTDITSGTLPSTNVIDDSSEGALTLKCFKDGFEQANRLGKRVAKVYMNPTERSDMWDWEHLVATASGGQQNSKNLITDQMKEIIMADGEISRMLGHDFEIVLDNTRPLNYLYFFASEPAGIFFDKPGFAKVSFWDEDKVEAFAERDFQEAVRSTRVIKPIIPAPNRLNFWRVQFA